VTLEPCSSHGRTPPCTEAIQAARLKRIVVGTTDPNPKHRGRAFAILRRAGLEVNRLGNVRRGDSRKAEPEKELADECERLNEPFNHWIVHRTPFVTVKAAMTLDGKIATAAGESKWITGARARAYGMRLRHGADAVLVGINTVLADDPALTQRSVSDSRFQVQSSKLRRIILDAMARTPPAAKVASDEFQQLTTIVVSKAAPRRRVAALAKHVKVLVAPARAGRINLDWLLKRLGAEGVTSLLVEGGGEVNASFLLPRLAQRVVFFYAPKILGGRDARKAVAGEGAERLADVLSLQEVQWRRLGPDLLLTARLGAG